MEPLSVFSRILTSFVLAFSCGGASFAQTTLPQPGTPGVPDYVFYFRFTETGGGYFVPPPV